MNILHSTICFTRLCADNVALLFSLSTNTHIISEKQRGQKHCAMYVTYTVKIYDTVKPMNGWQVGQKYTSSRLYTTTTFFIVISSNPDYIYQKMYTSQLSFPLMRKSNRHEKRSVISIRKRTNTIVMIG